MNNGRLYVRPFVLNLRKREMLLATAADEAMAMILRLQGEKASVEMEAKQYQRMVEAKSAFDTEEMNILKEILLRRETEKLILEKEVEAYRQMLFENEQSEINLLNTKASQRDGEHLLYPNENIERMSHQIDVGIGNLETLNHFAEAVVRSNCRENYIHKFGKELSVPTFEDDYDSPKLHEIHQNSADRYAVCEESERYDAEEDRKGNIVDEESQGNNVDKTFRLAPSNSREKTMIPGQERQEESSRSRRYKDFSMKSIPSCKETGVITEYHDNKIKKHGEDHSSPSVNVDCSVHDVRVIENEVNMTNEVVGSKEPQLQKKVPSPYPIPCVLVTSGRQDYKIDRSRSVSDMAYWLPSFSHPQGKTTISDMCRKSMSAFDFERVNTENELGCLRGRLRVVQQSRDGLSFPLGKREKDKTQLQLLGDMRIHPCEMQQETSAKRSLGQDSLPPLFSKVKVMSKKRWWRSTVQDLHSA